MKNEAAKSKRRKKVLDAVPVFGGRIINRRGTQYKIQYETDSGEQLVNWFPVSSIVATCVTKENLKKLSTNTVSNSDADNNLDENVPTNNLVSSLRNRLLEFDLVPVETIADGNCFFRAISRLVYGSDEYHLMVRRQAVEHVSDYPEYYQDYILFDYSSVEDYIYQMSRNSYWDDNAIIRATADALEIHIHVIS